MSGRRSRGPDLSDVGVVTVVTAQIHQEVQSRGGYPSDNGPEEGKGQQSVGGEESEEDVPGVIALRPIERTGQHLDGLRQPGDRRQAPEAK